MVDTRALHREELPVAVANTALEELAQRTRRLLYLYVRRQMKLLLRTNDHGGYIPMDIVPEYILVGVVRKLRTRYATVDVVFTGNSMGLIVAQPYAG